MKKNFLLVYLFLQTIVLQGQLQQIIHQSFAVDEMNQVNLDIFGDFTVEVWPGSEILTETTIKLTNASNSILEYLIDNERYAIELDTIEQRIVTLISKDMERREIKTSKGTCVEKITTRIFMPDFFEKRNEQLWKRKNPFQNKGKD